MEDEDGDIRGRGGEAMELVIREVRLEVGLQR